MVAPCKSIFSHILLSVQSTQARVRPPTSSAACCSSMHDDVVIAKRLASRRDNRGPRLATIQPNVSLLHPETPIDVANDTIGCTHDRHHKHDRIHRLRGVRRPLHHAALNSPRHVLPRQHPHDYMKNQPLGRPPERDPFILIHMTGCTPHGRHSERDPFLLNHMTCCTPRGRHPQHDPFVFIHITSHTPPGRHQKSSTTFRGFNIRRCLIPTRSSTHPICEDRRSHRRR